MENFKQVKLSTVKQGDYFKRKPGAKTEYIRNHYNRKDFFGPANYSCTDSEGIGREIFLKPATLVFVEV